MAALNFTEVKERGKSLGEDYMQLKLLPFRKYAYFCDHENINGDVFKVVKKGRIAEYMEN